METQTQPATIHNTFTIERSYTATIERVFAALSHPAKKRRWFVDSAGHEVDSYELDFRIGGVECARFRFKPGTPVAGMECINDARYLDIVPNRRIVFAQRMTIGGRCISVSLVTFELLPAAAGTDLVLTHQAAFLEGADGPEMRQRGWETLLGHLADELAL